jgi:hypothetical protein
MLGAHTRVTEVAGVDKLNAYTEIIDTLHPTPLTRTTMPSLVIEWHQLYDLTTLTNHDVCRYSVGALGIGEDLDRVP